MSRTTRSYASELARRSPSSPSATRSTRPALLLEPALHVLADGGIVLDDEDAHRALLRRRRARRKPYSRIFRYSVFERDAERGRRPCPGASSSVQHGLDVPALELLERDRRCRRTARRGAARGSCSGRSAARICGRRARAARRARSRCAARARCRATDTPAAASIASARQRRRGAPPNCVRKCCASSGMSTARSRSGGSVDA